jgi:murein DD-endopeptidase MepM/ murein hydrolase activator NlpD
MIKNKALLIFVAAILTLLIIVLLGFYLAPASNNPTITPAASFSTSSSTQYSIDPATSTLPSVSSLLYPPISNALTRVTKKPFSIKVSPGHSPVIPEKFSGYHTGVDFETFPNEQNIDIPISAVCTGSLIYKNWVSGYGGVAIQSCQINKQDVTVLYGHLKLASINIKLNQKVTAGTQLGILGKGYSTETNGERKHLHLGIHKGKAIILLGYVQNPKDLNNWLDAMTYLKP